MLNSIIKKSDNGFCVILVLKQKVRAIAILKKIRWWLLGQTWFVNNVNYAQLNTKDVFSMIYAANIWGSSKNHSGDFYSGPGSHTTAVIDQYVQAVKTFCEQRDGRLSILDIGCGDFNVGSKICRIASSYIACDIVEELINNNQRKFSNLPVRFEVMDAIDECRFAADVVILRQVLQHLSNEAVQKILDNIKGKFKYLILTEAQPEHDDFTENLDIITGNKHRVFKNSGLNITADPFEFSYKNSWIIADMNHDFGSGIERLTTTVYEL